MRYMMLVCADPTVEASAEDWKQMGPDTEAWVQDMDGRGVRLRGGPLEEPANARTVRRRRGELSVTDGPFAETKEHIAGFDILECRDLDEAIEVASKHPMAAFGALELRLLDEG